MEKSHSLHLLQYAKGMLGCWGEVTLTHYTLIKTNEPCIIAAMI